MAEYAHIQADPVERLEEDPEQTLRDLLNEEVVLQLQPPSGAGEVVCLMGWQLDNRINLIRPNRLNGFNWGRAAKAKVPLLRPDLRGDNKIDIRVLPERQGSRSILLTFHIVEEAFEDASGRACDIVIGLDGYEKISEAWSHDKRADLMLILSSKMVLGNTDAPSSRLMIHAITSAA